MDLPVLHCNGRNNNNNDGYDNVNANINARGVEKKPSGAFHRENEREMRFMLFRELNKWTFAYYYYSFDFRYYCNAKKTCSNTNEHDKNGVLSVRMVEVLQRHNFKIKK